MRWKLLGECKQCGECCKAFMQAQLMLDSATGYCRYLETDGSCRIRKSTLGIPKRDLEYWMRECKPYPNPDDPAHTPPRHHLLPNCGFKMVRA